MSLIKLSQLALTDYRNTFLVWLTADSLIEIFLETRVFHNCYKVTPKLKPLHSIVH